MILLIHAQTPPPVDTAVPQVWSRRPSRYGDLALVLFLLAQCFDGVFTYVGVASFGPGVEANPVIAMLMAHLGHGTGVMSAKIIASALGIALHVLQVHSAVALLSLFYLAAAIVPWSVLLFF